MFLLMFSVQVHNRFNKYGNIYKMTFSIYTKIFLQKNHAKVILFIELHK